MYEIDWSETQQFFWHEYLAPITCIYKNIENRYVFKQYIKNRME